MSVRGGLKILAWVICSQLLILHTGYADEATEQKYAPGDPQSCLGCHSENGTLPAADILSTVHGQKSNPKSPLAQHGCQSCHGASPQHLSDFSTGKPARTTVTFDDNTPAEIQNAQCLGCHQNSAETHWQGSVHQSAGLSCSSCHSVHKPQAEPLLKKKSSTELCFQCHQDIRARIHKTSAHPIVEGQMGCNDCHNPHGTIGDKLLTNNSVNETCYQCHAEKRGPFLWEHAPVRENCANCHDVHGTSHKPMLVSRGPWLCQRCHMASYHPSTAYSGTGIPPNGAAQQMLARNCMNCHTQVHGSNHPSGVRLTR